MNIAKDILLKPYTTISSIIHAYKRLILEKVSHIQHTPIGWENENMERNW